MIQRLEPGSRVGIISCSNGQKTEFGEKLTQLICVLKELSLVPVCTDCIYEEEGVFPGSRAYRAAILMQLYRDPSIRAIFDISGGDIANDLLPLLDYSVIAGSGKQFYGYSDLTTILNAIYAKTGEANVLYQVRNLIYDHGAEQREAFSRTVLHGKRDLTDIPVQFVQGERMEGTVIGGNVRCFLKLAGTPYLPDFTGKVLLLEALGGLEPQMTTYFSQLQQMGAFEQATGVLLGTFSKLAQETHERRAEKLLLPYVPQYLPVAKTPAIGHGTDARAIEIGGYIKLEKTEDCMWN